MTTALRMTELDGQRMAIARHLLSRKEPSGRVLSERLPIHGDRPPGKRGAVEGNRAPWRNA